MCVRLLLSGRARRELGASGIAQAAILLAVWLFVMGFAAYWFWPVLAGV